ncbi:MAG: DUF2461 family protein [Bacteroides cellulosilyticus]
MYDNIDEFRGIVENPDFKQYSGNRRRLPENSSQRFPKDFEYVQYLKCKEYTCYCNQPDSFFLASDCVDRTAEIFKQMKPFADFLNYTIDDFE